MSHGEFLPNESGDAAQPMGRIIHGPIEDDIRQVRAIIDDSFQKMKPTMDLVQKAQQPEGIKFWFKLFGKKFYIPWGLE